MAPGCLYQVVLAKRSARATTPSISHWRNQRVNQKYLQKNENRNTTIQNLWDAAKAVPRGKFIAIQDYLRTQKNFK